ncbi:MAG: HAMP domain-containing protein, partial [Planctomycetes bacterium]|nr:HAMP domain-containing protein [Planctomycetota bacterium]
MSFSLRTRIWITLLPLLALLAVLGGAGMVLLYRLGGSIDLILKENYESVIAMERLNEALERIDSSYQFTLAGREKEAREQYHENWTLYDNALKKEEGNITIHPREDELVARLGDLTRRYRQKGDAFYVRSSEDQAVRQRDYFGPGGLLETFREIKQVSGDILRLNEENMEEASRQSQALASRSLLWFALGLAAAVVLAGLMALRTIHSILRPLQVMTESALAIGLGNLDQVVPVTSQDELGQLADAFNTMGRQLRHYRKTGYAQLLRAQRTSQATIDSFPDPVLVVDSEAHIEMANPASQRLLGVTGKPEGASAAQVWEPPESLRQPFTEALRRQHAYQPEGFDQLVFLRADGKDLSFLPRILPIQDPYGNTLGAAVLLLNVTRFRLLDQVKSDLVATVSHELKTPLTSLRLAVHLLLEEAVGPLTPKQTELLVDARDNAERLLDRINRLLDLARLEQKHEPLDLRPESPVGLVKAAGEMIRPRAQDKGVELVVEAPAGLPMVQVDGPRLGLALNNLLDNALTYTNRGGRITLSAAAEDHAVVLAVTDTGQGIPPEHLPHVFDKFFRVPGQSRGSGTGLGLAIARE